MLQHTRIVIEEHICTNCNKNLTTKRNLENHIRICKNKKVNKNLFTCTNCTRILSTKHSLIRHESICKKNKKTVIETNNKIEESITIKKELIAIENVPLIENKNQDNNNNNTKVDQTIEQLIDKKVRKELEYKLREITYTYEDNLETVRSDMRSTIEDLHTDLKYQQKIHKEEIEKLRLELLEQEKQLRKEIDDKENQRIKEVELLKKEINEISKQKTLVNYTNNVNHVEIEKQEINITNNITNHITIFQLSPKRIGDLVSINFEPEHLIKGQVEYANIIHSILDSENVLYGVTDRSRNRFYYGNEKEQYVEDPNCMTLHSIFLPSLREMKKLFRDCINSPSCKNKEELHKGFIDILSVLENGTTFQSQLSKILPSIKGKDKITTKDDETSKEKNNFVKKYIVK
jgi:hypothetical protein